MIIVRSINEYRQWRSGVVGDLGFVATLGYHHTGHVALISRAKGENAAVVVSVYVNPTQFAAGEDFSTYPRDLERDAALCESAGADVLFAPTDEDMYPTGFSTTVTPSATMGLFEARHRPEHFVGVCTVVTKLLNIVRPRRTYFGLKDYQQLLLVDRTIRDLNMDVELVPVQTVREPDGLAYSSRNIYMTPEERASAPLLYRALREIQACLDEGERSVSAALARAQAVLGKASVPFTIDYFEVADPQTLQPVSVLNPGAVVLAAVRLPSVRLIDNLVLGGAGATVSA